MLTADLHRHRTAAATDTGIDHGEEHSVGGILASQGGKQVRRGRDAESGCTVQGVDD
jgi:hypothetical protein